MKKTFRLLSILLVILLLTGSVVQAETEWAYFDYTSKNVGYGVVMVSDDFLFKGTYGTTPVLIQLSCSGAKESLPFFYISFAIKDEDNTYTWSNNTGNDAFFDVTVTDETGNSYSFYGFEQNEDTGLQIFDSEDAFNTIVEYADRTRENCGDVLSLLLTDQKLDFVIANKDGSWMINFTADMSGFSNAYYYVYGDYMWDESSSATSNSNETSDYNPDEVQLKVKSDSCWGYTTENDEFGDPIEGSFCIMGSQYFEGVFDNSATYNSPLWANVLLNKYGFGLWFYQYQNVNSLYTNSYLCLIK